MKSKASRCKCGFTIIEALVALIIVSSASVTLLRVVEFSSLNLRRDQFIERAIWQVNSILANLEPDPSSNHQQLQGAFPNGDFWVIEIVSLGGSRPDNSSGLLKVYHVKLTLKSSDLNPFTLNFETIIARNGDKYAKKR